eukprot:4860079-Amphidinium_carterae.1
MELNVKTNKNIQIHEIPMRGLPPSSPHRQSLPQWASHAHSVLQEREEPKPAKPEWLLVVGKRGRDAVMHSVLLRGVFHWSVQIVFALLEHELNNDK